MINFCHRHSPHSDLQSSNNPIQHKRGSIHAIKMMFALFKMCFKCVRFSWSSGIISRQKHTFLSNGQKANAYGCLHLQSVPWQFMHYRHPLPTHFLSLLLVGCLLTSRRSYADKNMRICSLGLNLHKGYQCTGMCTIYIQKQATMNLRSATKVQH